ncbi:MAG: hypothetical protein GKR94_17685 [Gammaproteobacteria bacterium]|nr:hypothetical protein [Gammaproteobacteria bacterium]
MKEDEILARLRDIHIPGEIGAASSAFDFALWPIVAFALFVLAIIAARVWRARRWRALARADLAHILTETDASEQWARLLTFAQGLSARSNQAVALPAVAFHRPEHITTEQRSQFVAFLREQLRR